MPQKGSRPDRSNDKRGSRPAKGRPGPKSRSDSRDGGQGRGKGQGRSGSRDGGKGQGRSDPRDGGKGQGRSDPRDGGRGQGRRTDGTGPSGRVREDRDLAGPARWGRIARRGAGNIDYDDPDLVAKRPPRKPAADTPRDDDTTSPRRPPKPARDLPSAEDLQRSAAGAVRRGRGAPARERKPLPGRPPGPVDPAVSLRRLAGEQRGKSLNRRLNDAAKAFEGERYLEARTKLQPVVKEAPLLPEGRELMGLSLYRLGRWKDAIEQLEVFRELSGSTEQHPVLADCHRALGRWKDVDALWAELGEASPSGELIVEGRIVYAGSKADQGDLAGAIRVLEQGWRLPKNPRPHHLRRAYALADLYDRVGRAPRARELFKWIAGHDERLADVKARLRALG